MKTLVWYRGKDLRVADHAPLFEAAEAGGEVLPVFVLDPARMSRSRAGEAPHRIQFLLDSLRSLSRNLDALGSRLLVFRGDPSDKVVELAERFGVDRVVAHRWVEPFSGERGERVRRALGSRLRLYEGETLLPPGSVRTKDDKPYGVYSPFARRCRALLDAGEPLPAPKRLPAVPEDLAVADAVPLPTLSSLGLQMNPEVLAGGEKCARGRLKAFVERGLDGYAEQRDRMDLAGTSRLSADLKFGTLSIRTAWHAASRLGGGDGSEKFMSELLWREFAYHTLWDRPHLLSSPFRADFVGFPWRDATGDCHDLWQAWVLGRTGYPIVDAAARQLLQTGYVHNRARMIAASFLTKHLLIHYRYGEAHYLRQLTDGDWAQNNAGWQWSAGCGCDAQPYFRVFNPVSQGRKFDPDGDYVRAYVPELAKLPASHIHAPFEAPGDMLASAGVTLGQSYPAPIVEHRFARQRFLAVAQQHLRSRAAAGESAAAAR